MSRASQVMPLTPPRIGVRIAGTGHYVPAEKITNQDLMKVMDTTDEWIVQRTGIRERRRLGPGESSKTMAVEALKVALTDAGMKADELDLIVCATMTPDMSCPPTACLVADLVGAKRGFAFDVNGACSGFVYGMNVVHELIRGGNMRAIALIGVDSLTTLMDYSTAGRSTAIIFGDGAGAAIFRATDDLSRGVLAQAMHTDGSGWKEIFVPSQQRDFPPSVPFHPSAVGKVQMHGSNVFKFAVGTFPGLIEETLKKAGLEANDVDMFVCHQSNQRILHAARDRFGISEDRLYVNIDRVGNTVAASIPICLDELRRSGRIAEGNLVMFLGFGAGLTWGSSLWRI